MTRLIDADNLKDDFDCVGFNDYDDYNRALRIIDNAPTVERPKGKWIMNKTSARGRNYTCTRCEKVSRNKFHYCPNCGADMRGTEAENDKI